MGIQINDAIFYLKILDHGCFNGLMRRAFLNFVQMD